jgi:hypothetical protein
VNEKIIYPVVTIIAGNGDVELNYCGEYDRDTCPMRVSFFTTKNGKEFLSIPLWFPTDMAARGYMEKAAAAGTLREFSLIQEFTYKDDARQGMAKVIFSITSDTWPTLKEGNTERSPGVWAKVRSIFVCDKDAALDYVARFNEDCAAAFKAGRNNQPGAE